MIVNKHMLVTGAPDLTGRILPPETMLARSDIGSDADGVALYGLVPIGLCKTAAYFDRRLSLVSSVLLVRVCLKAFGPASLGVAESSKA